MKTVLSSFLFYNTPSAIPEERWYDRGARWDLIVSRSCPSLPRCARARACLHKIAVRPFCCLTADHNITADIQGR